jgi:hypothetical protein
MAAYRKRQNRDVWHWCTNCAQWPKQAGYDERKRKPTTGELCNQCRSKEARGDCIKAQ